MATLTRLEMLETLLRRLGSAQALASVMHVTEAAVSAQRREGKMSDQSAALLARLLTALDWRTKFIRGWLWERTTRDKGKDFEVVVESATNFDSDQSGKLQRFTVTKPKAVRSDYAEQIAKTYLDWEMVVNGDVLVFLRRGSHTTDGVFVYLNQEKVETSFSKSSLDPFWPLRNLTRPKGE